MGLGQYVSFLLYREVQVAMQMSQSWEESLSLVMRLCFNLYSCYQYQDTRETCINFFLYSLSTMKVVNVSLLLTSSFSR